MPNKLYFQGLTGPFMGKSVKKKRAKFSRKAGLPPGTLVHIGAEKTEDVWVSVIDFNTDRISEDQIKNLSDCSKFLDQSTSSWINIDGIHDVKIVGDIGKTFGLHDLILEDITNTLHRPSTEVYDAYVFLTLKMMGISEDKDMIISEQISLVLGTNWVLSFQEKRGDIFEPIRARLREESSRLRKYKTDYLFYRLIDSVVDNYFFVMEHISEKIELLEEKVFSEENIDLQREIQELRKELINVRKSVVPLREAINTIIRDENDFIEGTTSRYFKDVHDHIIQVLDMSESQRDILSGLMDLYMSGISNRMNQVMKVLTIISTIFIPMTFIAGIYGMNFEYMPELQWRYGYFFIWGIMFLVFIVMLIFFKRNKWL